MDGERQARGRFFLFRQGRIEGDPCGDQSRGDGHDDELTGQVGLAAAARNHRDRDPGTVGGHGHGLGVE
jgi:hypothetical protein